MNSKDISIVGETKCISDFTSLGYTVSIPYGDNAPYDLIVDINGKLNRVQVKTSNSYSKENVINFHTKKTYYGGNKWNNNKYDKNDFDLLYLYNYMNKESYLFFVNEILDINDNIQTQINIRIINNNNEKIKTKQKINYNIDNLFSTKIMLI